MENEEQSTEDMVKIVSAASINFERKNDLVKTLKKLDKSVDAAIEFLDGIVRDVDEDKSTRMKAAQFIVEKKIAISESVSKDALSRAIAASRVLIASQTTKKEKAVEDEDEDTPLVGYEPTVILKAPMDISNIKSL